MRRRRVAAGWCVSVVLGGACAAVDQQPGRAADATLADAVGAVAATAWPPYTWRDEGAHALATDGVSATIALVGGAGPRGVVVRARPLQALPATVCLAIEEVRDAVGAPWPSSPSPRPADPADVGAPRWQPAYALAVFPGVQAAALPAGGLTLRVALRACAGGTPVPTSALGAPAPLVQVESAALAAIVGRPRLPLQVAVGGGATHAAWAPALEVARGLFAAAGIDLALPPALELHGPLPPLAPLRLGVGHQLIADAVAAALDEAAGARPAPPSPGLDHPTQLLVVPCLDYVGTEGTQSRLRGHATRLPGGPRLAGVAGFAVVGTPSCAPPGPADAERLGRTVAHELGHLLGLRHATTPGPDVMAAAPADVDAAAAFSATQAAAMTRSPLVIAP